MVDHIGGETRDKYVHPTIFISPLRQIFLLFSLSLSLEGPAE